MSTVINLNKVRKAKARSTAEQLAAENRIRYGRSKAEKLKQRAEIAAAANKLDGHHLNKPAVD